MKRLALVLIAGQLVFLALAMGQEWEVFAPWFGASHSAPTPEVDPPTRARALDAVQGFLTVMRHLYASGGDPRFTERLLAAEDVVDEILDDVALLQHRRRGQELTLVHLEALAVERLGPERLEVRTKEYWTHSEWELGDPTAPRLSGAQVQYARYLLGAVGERWRIEAWEIVPAPASPAPAGQSTGG